MNEVSPQDLQQVNLANLKWLETYTIGKPNLQVGGVEIMRCFTYDLIQIFNNAYLKEQLYDTQQST
jgi:hypothetical protein